MKDAKNVEASESLWERKDRPKQDTIEFGHTVAQVIDVFLLFRLNDHLGS